MLLAGLAAPLVLSVHSVVSFDFAVAIVPGWHSTIFPPYFVAGAIYSGFAMVLNIIIPIRKIYGLENLITARHLNNMAIIMLATGMMVAYGYVMEAFMSWYSGDIFEQFMMANRAFGPYGWIFWALMLFNVSFRKRCGQNKSAPTVVAVFRRAGGQHRHVGRTLCHRRHELAPRFHAVRVGHVSSDILGLGDAFRQRRIIFHAAVFVYPLPADDRNG